MYRFGSRIPGRTADCRQVSNSKIRHDLCRVGVRGFEPRTSSLSGMRSKPTELYARPLAPWDFQFYIVSPVCQTLFNSDEIRRAEACSLLCPNYAAQDLLWREKCLK